MERAASLFLKIETNITRLALWAAIGFLVIAVALAIYQVTTRFAFGRPSTWSEVITRSAMIWSVFLGVAPAFREGTMIALEFIQTALPRRLGHALYQLSMVLTLVFFADPVLAGASPIDERVANQTLAPRCRFPSHGSYRGLPVRLGSSSPSPVWAAMIRARPCGRLAQPDGDCARTGRRGSY